MNTIAPVLLANYNSALIGRLKLKLFKLISGQEGVAPSKKQLIAYVKKAAKENYDWGEMITGVITNERCLVLQQGDLSTQLNIDDLFAKLDQYPLDKPLFIEVENSIFGYPVGAWISAQKLSDCPGYFYAIQMVSDVSFPDGLIQYAEIRVSQDEPEPAFLYWKGERTVATKHDLSILDDPALFLGVQMLDYLARRYRSTFVSLPGILENKRQEKIVERNRPIDDPEYLKLVKQLMLGKIKAAVAYVELGRIRPFSYQECFNLPLCDIEQGLKLAGEFNEKGLMVYYKGGFLITSDDYLHYMSLRINKTPKVKVIIIGDQLPGDIRIIKKGGAELLTPVLFSSSPVNDTLNPELNDRVLENFLDQLRMVHNTRNLINVNCIVLTEDKHTDMLENLLLSCGFMTDQLRMMSYEGCTNTGALPMIVATLEQIRKNMLYIVHRDGDYLRPEQGSDFRQKVRKLDLIPFLTSGTDVEAYYLNVNHIHYLYPVLPVADIEQMIEKATMESRSVSLERMRKYHYPKNPNGLSEQQEQGIIN
ncbi:hypothetical protein ACFJIV_12650 [Mucilaginibacter sp. UC70_90]